MIDQVFGNLFCIGRKSTDGVSLMGTAFAVGNDLVATTGHVVGASDQELCAILPKLRAPGEYQDTTGTDVQTIKAEIASYDAIRDLALVRLRGVTFLSPFRIGGLDEVVAGRAVCILGFPHAPNGRLVLTEQIGHVGAKVLVGSHGVETKQAILNIQARPGQSGGPVVDLNSGQVIAVVVGSYAPGGGGGISLGGVDPHTLHQTTHAISAEYVREML